MASQTLLRALPSVDKVLSAPACQALIKRHGRSRCTHEVRQILTELRSRITEGLLREPAQADELISMMEERLRYADSNSFIPVINLTGTVLHTNLGRAALPDTALQAITDVASGASNLEFDIGLGKRGDRDDHISALISELTGAEAATVVNNNAAAVLLSLNTLAQAKDVCISRGELVEIGGSFRIPEVMEKSGSRLVEVGATNRTHRRDYEKAITADTGLLLKVHTSNYEIKGFTSDVTYEEIAELARLHDIPFLADLGSGTLVNLEQYGLPHEPTVQDVLQSGVDLVTFSGDKLLGGPQAGIIAGRADLVQQIKANPLKRALRVDKMTMAALVEVLKLFRQPERLVETHPTIRHLSRSRDDIANAVDAIQPAVQEALQGIAEVRSVATSSQIGSGALPIDQLPSQALEITPIDSSEAALQGIIQSFRKLPTPVIGRIQGGRFLLDLRTLDDPAVLSSLLAHLEPG